VRWRFIATTVTLLAIACGSRTELDDGAAGAIAPDASDVGSTEEHQRACDPTSPFTSIVPLTIDTAEFDESDIRFTPDELTAYFVSNRAKEPGWGNDAFVTHRAAITDAFSVPVRLPGIAAPNSWANDPNPTADNLDLCFEGGCVVGIDNPPTLCGAHRDTADGAFGPPFIIGVGVAAVPKFGWSVYTIHDGAIAYFSATNINGHGGLARAARVDADTFGAIEPVQIGATPGDPYAPVVSENETVIFFESLEDNRVSMATRQDATKPFTNVHVVDELASDLESYANWVSPDGCRLYFTRFVATEAGSQRDVLVASH